jgi:peptidyl-prolyl cis-trans isomerase D
MIKILRFANEKYPWFLAATIGFIAVTFVVGMGWWGFGESAGSVVATVGDESISLDEFKRAYENTYRFYKEKVPGEFKDETIKQYVVEQLVDHRVWLIAAHKMGLKVSDEDLRESILQTPEFQRNGHFDPEHYQRLLAANHMTPSMFESMQARELLSLKARMLVSDAVALTPAELTEAQALMLRQQESDPSKAAAAKERTIQDVLLQKQQRTLAAYAQSLKATLPISVRRELL